MKIIIFITLTSISFNLFGQSTIGLTQYTEPNTAGYVLFAPVTNTQTYLVDKCGRKMKEWSSNYKAGLSAILTPTGNLLRAGALTSSYFGTGGGKGGVIQKIDWNGNLIWEYVLSSSLICQHHDVKELPNGNVLAIVWELKTGAEAILSGKDPSVMSLVTSNEIWSEKIVEIQPVGATGGIVVWEWKLFDHLVQDVNGANINFGVIADHPELININYTSGPATSADWVHINSIDYNEQTDQILMSSHNLEEIWIIDHSTTTLEAASHLGGNSNKGGDLLYRWGNPEVYGRGNATNKMLYKQHHASWIPTGYPNAGKILIFNNGVNRPGGNSSSTDIISPPIDVSNNYSIGLGQAFLPTNLDWTYQDPIPSNLFATNISGVFPLQNGSFLITNGPKGETFEIDALKNTTWKYVNPVNVSGPQTQGTVITGNSVFRFGFYAPDFSGFVGNTLTAGGEIELNPAVPSLCGNVGLSDNQLEETFIYPNPGNGMFSIETNLILAGQIDIYNVIGEKVKTIESTQSKNVIDLMNFPKGMYWVNIYTSGQVISQKIILE
jgi:hypothetical protein